MTTVYISPTGAGNRSGVDWANAATLSNLNKMIVRAGDGGTVLLKADEGSYQVSNSISLSSGGQSGQPVTIRGVTSNGTPHEVTIEGNRPREWDATNPSGTELFRLGNGADHLIFENFTINNVKNAFHVTADINDLTLRQMTVNNVERFLEDFHGGSAKSASIIGLTVQNVDVSGFSKGVIRLQYNTHDVIIENVNGDSRHQDGADFAIGIHLDGTVHDVVINDTSIGNITDTTNYYWNGDGFATEWGVSNVLFKNTKSYGNTDAGYDLKSSQTVLVGALAEDNKKNFRIWGEATLIDTTGFNPNKRGGSDDQLQVDILGKGKATIIGGNFTDAGSATTVFRVAGELNLVDTKVAHAAGGELVAGSNGKNVIGLDAVDLARVAAVGPSSPNYAWKGVYGQLGDPVLVQSGTGNEALNGTNRVDVFFYNNAIGKQYAQDALRGFSSEDRLVTTIAFSDPDGDGIIKASQGDRFFLNSTEPGHSSGSLSILGIAGNAISKIKLLDTLSSGGSTHYIYGTTEAKVVGPLTVGLINDMVKTQPGTVPRPGTNADEHPNGRFANAVSASHSNDTLKGTADKDIFLFDAANGQSGGVDLIRNFGNGDRIVTTARLLGSDKDGVVRADSSDRLTLHSAGAETASTATLKIFNENDRAVSRIQLVETVVEKGTSYYVYAASGEDAASSHPPTVDGSPAIVPPFGQGVAIRVNTSVGNDMLLGTSNRDYFIFDTFNTGGSDVVKNFGSGDSIVTTSKILDANGDGRITFNSSDRLTLMGPNEGSATDDTVLKIFNVNGKVLSQIELVGTVHDQGADYYIYGAVGDTIAKTDPYLLWH